MEPVRPDAPSSYIQYLPVIYQGDAETGAFIGNFLKIFEKLLAGINDGEPLEGIEEVIDRVYEFFDPDRTRSEFLNWLAGWMALILRDDWEETKKRRLINRIMSLYRIRGTKRGIEEFLKIYVGTEGANIFIIEQLTPLQLGDTSTIGFDTIIGGSPPHYFIVRIEMQRGEKLSEIIRLKEKAVRDIVDREKPAHTYYDLVVLIPTMQVGFHSTVGEDTILGNWMI